MSQILRRLLTSLACGLAVAACASPSLADPVSAINAPMGLALHGYDPVAYFRDASPTPGRPEHSLEWGGATWRFATAENRSAFEAEPQRYAPAYGGYCAYAMSINRIADIDPHAWEIVDGKLYLNNNKAIHVLWSAGKRGRIAKGDRNWAAYPKRPAMSDADTADVGAME